MAKKEKQQKKKKGQSVQDMMGIQTFTKYGLMTDKGELLFYASSGVRCTALLLLLLAWNDSRFLCFYCEHILAPDSLIEVFGPV